MAALPSSWQPDGDGWWNGRDGYTTTARIDAYEVQGLA
jgi:hypothetical protein